MGQLGMVLMGFTDVVMLGNYNSLSLSSAGFGNAVFFLFLLLGVGTMYAVSAITSISVGEGVPQQAIPIFKSSNWVAFFLSIVLMLLNLLVIEYIEWFEQPKEMNALAKEYIRIVNFSVPAMLFFNSGKQLLDGLGKTKVAMYVTFGGLLMNVILNDCLIYGRHGFEEMGLKGAAWATVISRVGMAIFQLAITWWHPMVRNLKLLEYKSRSYFMEILKVGVPIGFTFFFEIAAFSFAMIFAGRLSVNHAAAHQIAISLASVTYMFITGISSASTIVVGNHFGAADPVGVRRSGIAAILLVTLIELIFALVFFVFYKEIPQLFNDKQELLELTYPLIILAAFFQLGDGLQAVGAGALRGIKDTKASSVIAFISYWVIMTPGAYLLCFKFNYGLPGVWLAFVVGLSLAALLLNYRFLHLSKGTRLDKLIKTQLAEDEIGNNL